MAWFYSTPLAYLLIPADVTNDHVTKALLEVRAKIEEKRLAGVDPELIAQWQRDQNQMEWEHVRRLQADGCHDDPFLLQKLRGQTRNCDVP